MNPHRTGIGIWLRNAAIAWIALCLLARPTIGLAQAFGIPIADIDAHSFGPLGDPLALLGQAWAWSWAQTETRPELALLGFGLTAAFVISALGLLAIVGQFPPFGVTFQMCSKAATRWIDRPDLQRSASTGQRGTTGASGLALGAVRDFPLTASKPIAIAGGNVLVLGERAATERAMLAAISSWSGAVVLIKAGGLASHLTRKDVLRFAPGRPDTIGYNPLLAIRGGGHAWGDATRLANAWLGTGDGRLTQAFAVLILDQLLAAPMGQRHLAALHRRLARPAHVLADICAAWDPSFLTADPPFCDIARTVLDWRAEPQITLDALQEIDAALELFADGAYADATDRLQLRMSDLITGDTPGTLVIQPPAGDGARAARLMATLLAQLVADCASSPDIDLFGRPKTSDLLIAIDAEMTRQLRAAIPSLVPPHAARNGVLLLLATDTMVNAPNFAFDAIAAIGPQTSDTAAELSPMCGVLPVWRQPPSCGSRVRDLLLPLWQREDRPAVSPKDLMRAEEEAALLLLSKQRPIRTRALAAPDAAPSFRPPESLPPIAHDWTAPPIPRPSSSPSPDAPTPPLKPISARIRKALAGPIQRPLPLASAKPTEPPTNKKPGKAN